MTIRQNLFPKIALFLALTTCFYAIFFYQILNSQTVSGINAMGIMWSAGLAAILTKLLFDKTLKGLGWRPKNIKWHIVSYFIPVVAALIVYGTAWISGIGGVNPDYFATSQLASLPVPVIILLTATLSVILGSLSALGEEIGWRGFLMPELHKKFSYTQTSLMTGAIWFLFHVPLIIFSDYNNNAPLSLALICFLISVIAVSFITGWLRFKTGSLWTGVLIHAVHNAFIQDFFDLITIDKGKTQYFTTEFGLGLAVVYSLIAFYFWTRREEIEKNFANRM